MSNEIHGSSQQPVMMNFYAEWCHACKLFAPVLMEVKDQIGERATVINIDIDKNDSVAKTYDVKTVPTVIIFSNGEELWRNNGVASLHEILDQINLHIT